MTYPEDQPSAWPPDDEPDELNVRFDNGLYLDLPPVANGVRLTLLYRWFVP